MYGNSSKEKGQTCKSDARPLIHLWCPDLFAAKGGIATFSSFLLRAIQQCAPRARLEVILKHDITVETENGHGLSNTGFHLTGQWPLPLRTSAYAAKLIGLGVTQRPDLVITTHLNFTAAARILNKAAKVPYWTIAHGIDAWGIKRRSLQASVRAADRILAVSNYTRDRLLEEQDLSPEKVTVLPNTVDDQRFQIGGRPARLLEKYAIRQDQPVLLTVCRLVASEGYKGYDRVLRLLPSVLHRIPDLRYVIVGRGDDRDRVEGLVAELGLGTAVILAGFVPDEELCDYYNLCDVFAMPSKGEGFGIVYLEAMACGKPTLGGNKDGAIDALCDGRLGALIDPDDPNELAETLVQMIQGVYPLPLMYQPHALRRAMLDIYGFDSFKQSLSEHLDSFFARRGYIKP
jgi:glycosyltransferase involved in cell wall biosynthesis